MKSKKYGWPEGNVLLDKKKRGFSAIQTGQKVTTEILCQLPDKIRASQGIKI